MVKNCGFGEHPHGGDSLGLEFETGFQGGLEFGIMVQGYYSLSGIW